MGTDRRPEAGLERPTIAGGGFNVLPVEHLFRFVEVRHGVEFIPVIRVYVHKPADNKGLCREEFRNGMFRRTRFRFCIFSASCQAA